MAKKIVETPLMKQYAEMKKKHPDAVLLFRVGDFYETFSDDALVASEILGITLTRRANGAAAYVELAGFPHHALDTYLPKLVRAGKRVAICEQLEDPKLAKGLVKRDITELVTPGVSLNDNVLDRRENNFLGAVHVNKDRVGVAFLDVSTGEFLCAEGNTDYVDKLLGSFGPKELLIERGKKHLAEDLFSGRYLIFELEDWVFTQEAATERLLKQFGTRSLKGYGLARMNEAVIAAGAALSYLDVTVHTHTSHINTIRRIDESEYVRLDRFTVRNLELLHPLSEEGLSLLQVLDHTLTPMGARRLGQWLAFPLCDAKAINARLNVVEYFFRDTELRDNIGMRLERIGDLQRLVQKVATLRVTPREVVQICAALEAIRPIKAMCMGSDLDELRDYGSRLDPCESVAERIAREINPDAPAKTGSGDVIARGVNPRLDNLRDMAKSGKDYLENMRRREIEDTGITSLKIGFNSVFGYYIEVTNAHRDKVPESWIRRQTLTSAERYITPELKEYEEKILTANADIESLETSLFNDLVAYIARHIPAMQKDSALLADIDCLLSLTQAAAENHYVRPVVDDSMVIELTEARHPVIEKRLPAGEPYIANSVSLDPEKNQVLMITGPNMSGKSALLRQTALNVIMAQAGSFVAAESAHIGVVDKVFTRVGASDNISLGESTFMVEMTEAASIINNMSDRSLILFDELGRGTSTYDGISIARAIVEHIHASKHRPKTLFATHYHELNEMEKTFSRVHNFHVSVREIDGKVVFMRRLEPGGSEHSFGIHVARLAGMPAQIVRRADDILHQLEEARRSGSGLADTPDMTGIDSGGTPGMQLSFFQLDDPVLSQVRDEILGLDINNLTPVEALNKLNEISKIISGK